MKQSRLSFQIFYDMIYTTIFMRIELFCDAFFAIDGICLIYLTNGFLMNNISFDVFED